MEFKLSSLKQLHNFAMPPLRWGKQKFFRCRENNHISAVKSNPTPSYSSFGGGDGVCDGAYGNTQIIRSQKVNGTPHRRSDNPLYCFNDSDKKRKMCFSSSKPPLASEKRLRIKVGGGEVDVNGIAAVREKVIIDFQNEAVKMKDEILRKENFRDDVSKTPAVEDGVRLRNLRIRRAVLEFERCGIGGTIDGGGGGGERETSPEIMIKSNSNTFITSPLRVTGDTSPRRQSTPAVEATASSSPSRVEKERSKFSGSLTRREIEDDFMAIVGRKPNRRPKKRAKCVQKTLDKLLPGLWLTEITADKYEVTETQ